MGRGNFNLSWRKLMFPSHKLNPSPGFIPPPTIPKTHWALFQNFLNSRSIRILAFFLTFSELRFKVGDRLYKVVKLSMQCCGQILGDSFETWFRIKGTVDLVSSESPFMGYMSDSQQYLWTPCLIKNASSL